MIKCKLIKTSSNQNKLRTNEIEGIATIPIVGKSFILIAKGLEFGTRHVQTSIVQSVESSEKEINFTTLNSSYKLLILD